MCQTRCGGYGDSGVKESKRRGDEKFERFVCRDVSKVKLKKKFFQVDTESEHVSTLYL